MPGYPAEIASDGSRVYWIGLEGVLGILPRAGRGRTFAAIGDVVRRDAGI